MPREISRRRFLEGGGMAVGAMVLGASGASRLAACGDGSSGKAGSIGVSEAPEQALEGLRRQVGPRLVRVTSPLDPCVSDPSGTACAAAMTNLANPFFCEDDPGAFQTLGWFGAFEAHPSPYAVAAETTADIAAAVNFARETGVRLVVKGTGHDYQGRSSAADSLLIWTHNMRDITLHDDFRPAGTGWSRGVPAITVGAGTRWLEAYLAAGRRGWYVQGGGCTSVGAAGGFTQGGGFGSFSKRFGTAAGNLLEAEVVTADGRVMIANEARHSDLFWALRGGGGGTFGIVSQMTMRAHPLPETLGAVTGTVTAATDDDYRDLVETVVRMVPALDNPHWGEQIGFGPGNTIRLSPLFVDLAEDDARAAFAPLTQWVNSHDSPSSTPIEFITFPFADLWNATFWDNLSPGFIHRDRRTGQNSDLFWWESDAAQVAWYLESYQSRWLPRAAFEDSPAALAASLFTASRRAPFALHLNKGLSGAAPQTKARERATCVNPAALDASALLIMSSAQHQVYPGIPGREPDQALAHERTASIDAAMGIVRNATPDSGAYLNEADYFEPDWQRSFWGPNYRRLLSIKDKYDPTGLFQVHHGVGSDR